MQPITLSARMRTNLLVLQKTQDALAATHVRISTGRKVDRVVDDVSSYFQIKSLDDRVAGFETRRDEIDQSVSAISTALTATSAIDGLLRQLKGILVAAKTSTASERSALSVQYNSVKSQIDYMTADASYQGLTLVANSQARLATEFSDRSASRLDITGQRLTTYNTSAAGTLGTVTNASIASLVTLTAPTVGLYYLERGGSTGANFSAVAVVKYAFGNSVGAAVPTDLIQNGTVVSANIVNPYYLNVASIRGLYTDTYTNTSGLNIFFASQMFIYVGAELTGSAAIQTVSTGGTLWSAAIFAPDTGLGAETFNRALDFVVAGVDDAILQNRSFAGSMVTNVSILQTRLSFTQDYMRSQTNGARALALADVQEEGANLVALQTKLQLVTRGLAFGAETERSILRIFS
ncbi:flagellin [Elstera cyanobacteriorum]|uniref:Flagellin N-terminal domain-containing protein n=1 Tax=Elstera cyanobacteriorum TaxID=2022747 RepID=A0A255XIR9_9PROT|nr:hypothetical protein [Elstera cyanobacteriorum]MCK6443011.1 hypothetical protein [Elstera cyanobacteriorum]OYQ16873.1 hypothetical protein CHR90_18040 [Elstera cyanobacteriorum]GFZ89168.1 hypothetical protein GCM10011497_18150 [Elstera cyanobacteriorum]